MKPQLRPLLLIILALPLAAFAGGTATVQSGHSQHKPDRSSIEWRDAQNVRLQKPGEPQYFLMHDGKSYVVMSHNGKPRVIDLSSLSSIMQASGKDKPGFINGTFKPTGKTETVAGISGHVYHATWSDAEGKHEGDAVLTDDPRAVEMTRAYLALADSISGQKKVSDRFKLPPSEPGLLRLGDQFRVVTISDKAPPAKQFKLPAKPMSLMDLMKPGSGN